MTDQEAKLLSRRTMYSLIAEFICGMIAGFSLRGLFDELAKRSKR